MGRRRGTARIVGVVVLVLLAGVGAVLWVVRGAGSAGPDPLDLQVAPRGPGQVSLALSPTSGYTATMQVADGSRQTLTVRELAADGSGSTYAGQVTAYDPGTFDPAVLRAGRRTQVAGRDAWYLPEYVFGGDGAAQRTAVLGWLDPTGVWLLAYADTAANEGRVLDPDGLRRLAETVLISPPHDLRAPFRLGWLPAGLTMTYLANADESAPPGSATVGLSPAARLPSAAASYTVVPKDLDLAVSAAAPGKGWAAEKKQLTGAVTIAGKPAWLTGRTLVVDAGQCIVRIRTRTQRPRTELAEFVKQMLVGDCTQPDGWTVPAG